ncbi:MAG: hypothetical protein Q9168_004679 [Polycauliona sp. 1 TL-2023]
MADITRDRLTGLAPELRHMIAGSFSRKELKALRLISKAWNDTATPIVFSELTYRLHTTPDQWKKWVKFEKGAMVKTLYIKSTQYQIFSRSDLASLTNLCASGDFNTVANQQHPRPAIEIQRQRLVQLSSLIGGMTNLRNVKLTGDSHHDFCENHARNEYCLFCRQLANLRLITSEDFFYRHSWPAVHPESTLVDLGALHLLMLMTALPTANNNFPELHVQQWCEDNISYDVFFLPVTDHVLALLSRLIQLHLVMDGGRESIRGCIMTQKGFTSVGQWISWAVNLRHLTLELLSPDYKVDEAPYLVLRGCRLPKLLTCSMNYSTASYPTIADFVRACPGLTHLSILDREYKNLNSVGDELRKGFPRLNLDYKE